MALRKRTNKRRRRTRSGRSERRRRRRRERRRGGKAGWKDGVFCLFANVKLYTHRTYDQANNYIYIYISMIQSCVSDELVFNVIPRIRRGFDETLQQLCSNAFRPVAILAHKPLIFYLHTSIS